MRNLRSTLLSACIAAIGTTACNSGPAPDLIRYVNPLTGTGASTTVSALTFSAGTESLAQTTPNVCTPNPMTLWTPQTRATEVKCVAPYYYKDSLIQGFRGSHWINGGCAADYGTFTLMPVTGTPFPTSETRASVFSHDSEISTPAYYSVRLERYGIDAEMTALQRTAIFRFDYEGDETPGAIVQINNDRGLGFIEIDPQKREIRGYNPVNRQYRMNHLSAHLNGYFVVRFDRDFESWSIFGDSTIQSGATTARNLKDMGATVTFKDGTGKITAKAGTSFTGLAGAQANLDGEIPEWDFTGVKKEAEKQWNEHLSKIRIEGATDQQKDIFYTAFYHTSLLPRKMNDLDGQRPAFTTGETVPTAYEGDYYDDFSMWDIYRATLPLTAIIEPQKTNDYVNSFIAKYEEGGWLPIFPLHNNYTSAMIGDHGIAMIGDAWCKGIRNYDIEKAYAAMRQNAFDSPDSADYKMGMGRRALKSYLEYGYVPLEDPVLDAFHRGEQVSRTLEYAYDDFVLAQVAKDLGKTDDYDKLTARAANYKNVLDPETKWARGRYADGRFIEPFDPAVKVRYITEGTPKHYTWYVPQDVQGLIDFMGEETFVANLDSMFAHHFYWHGNEPGHQTAFLFNWAGLPWKTQGYVRDILRTEYADGPGGLCGNEDSGQMSAWYMLSSMGFYPVCPGVPQYAIASPMYPKTEIELPGGKVFTIVANNASDENVYIQSATLDGKPYDKSYFTHDDIANGSTLVFEMGPEPNKAWAAGKEARPYSMTPVR